MSARVPDLRLVLGQKLRQLRTARRQSLKQVAVRAEGLNESADAQREAQGVADVARRGGPA